MNFRSSSTRKQPGLRRRAELADLVEEQRAAAGGLEIPGLALVGAGERAALVPEQLALEERLRERAAVEPDERPRRARALAVDLLGDHLLADAGLAQQQHRGLRRRHAPHPLEDLRHRGIADHHTGELARDRRGVAPVTLPGRLRHQDLGLTERDRVARRQRHGLAPHRLAVDAGAVAAPEIDQLQRAASPHDPGVLAGHLGVVDAARSPRTIAR